MKYVPMILSVTILAACGGGGGGGNTPTTPALTPTAALNSANQTVAAQDTTTTSFMPVVSTKTITGAQTIDESTLFQVTRAQWDKLPAYIARAKTNDVLTGAVITETEACSKGGSMNASINDQDDNGTPSAGDVVTITLNGCVESEGTMTGTMVFAINKLTGAFNSNNSSVELTITLQNFSIASGQGQFTANGSLNISETTNGLHSSTSTVSTPSLTLNGTYAGQPRTVSMSNYNATMVTTPSPLYVYETSYSLSGFLTSSSLSTQSISFSTPTPFNTRFQDTYPSSGTMLIAGANNSKIRLTALSKTQVKQELDANGDGTYENNSTVAWNTLK